MRKKILAAIFACILLLNFLPSAMAEFKLLDDQGLTQRIIDVSNQAYFEKSEVLINSAKDSIYFCLFMIMPPSDQVLALLEDIENALAAGVEVNIFINTRYNPDGWVFLTKHFFGRDRNQIKIFPVAENHYLFQKLIIIDRRFVLEGSINWDMDSKKETLEFALLSESPEIASKKINILEGLPHANERQGDGYLFWRSVLRGVPQKSLVMNIPMAMMTDERYFNYMLEKDPQALDAYLLLAGARSQGG